MIDIGSIFLMLLHILIFVVVVLAALVNNKLSLARNQYPRQ